MISFLRLPDDRYVNVAAITTILPGYWDGGGAHSDGCTIRTIDGFYAAVPEWTAEQAIAHLAELDDEGTPT